MPRNVTNKIAGFSIPNTGSKTVGLTVAQLSPSNRDLSTGVQILALDTNTGDVFVSHRANMTPGDNDATDGFRLIPGSSVMLPARHESDIYVMSSLADQKISFLSF